MGVAEGNDAKADDHGNDGVTAAATPMHGFDGIKNVLRGGLAIDARLQLVREDIEQHFGIGIGRQVAAVLTNQHVSQLVVIREIAVVREADTVGRIHIERLCFG